MERRPLTRADLTPKLIGAIVTNADQTFGNAIVVGVHPGSNEVEMSTHIYGVRREFSDDITLIALNVNDHVQNVLGREVQAMSDFKQQVGRAAMAAAREHEWCSEVREVLKDLDVPLPNEHVDARVTVTFDLTFLRIDQAAWNKTELGNPDLDWVKQSFSVGDEGLAPEFEGDSQLELKSVRYVDREVLELRESAWED